MHKYSDRKINRELERIERVVQKRVETFVKNLSKKKGRSIPNNVREMQDVLSEIQNRKNVNRRGREMAIMEMKRFLRSKNSSFTQSEKSRKASMVTWRGYGLKVNDANFDEFFDFLQWVKSFYGAKYEMNSVIQAWNVNPGDVETAQDIFESMRE